MVLSAGLGTRLRPLTDHRAKALVPIGDRPALAHLLDRLRAAGAPRLVVNAHHHLDQIVAFADREAPDLRVSRETELLGTAGGVAQAAALLGDGDVLVWNGDIQADLDPTRLVGAHAGAATLLVQPLPAGEGAVGTDAEGLVVRLRDTRFGAEVRGGHFLGISVLSAALRGQLPPAGGLVEDVWIPAIARGETIQTVPFDGAWRDIGSVERYVEANLAWLAARGERAWVAPDAHVSSEVTLEASVVGAGAVVEGEGGLGRCVVWPGARCRAPLRDAVVTS